MGTYMDTANEDRVHRAAKLDWQEMVTELEAWDSPVAGDALALMEVVLPISVSGTNPWLTSATMVVVDRLLRFQRIVQQADGLAQRLEAQVEGLEALISQIKDGGPTTTADTE